MRLISQILIPTRFLKTVRRSASIVSTGRRRPREFRAADRELLRAVPGADRGLRAGHRAVVLRPGVGGGAQPARPRRALPHALLARAALRLPLRAGRETCSGMFPERTSRICSFSDLLLYSDFYY